MLPKDGRYGARGEGAVKMFQKRIDYTARRGSPEFASRPYMLYNIGTLLSFDNSFTDKELSRRAVMAYEMSIAHAAGTWLNGNWATPAGRSYPAYVTQAPGGCADMLWTYFGGKTPRLGGNTTAVFSVAESWRPHPLIVKAATDRSRAYVHRSRFDGERHFQTSFVNKTYALFSTAITHPPTGGRTSIWGQTYPYGVMFDQPDTSKASICWITVPCFDDQPLTNYTQGVSSRFCEYLQHRGSMLLVANNLTDPSRRPKVRDDIKGHKTFSTEGWYVLSYIPHGYQAVINDSKTTGRVFLDYGSVLTRITLESLKSDAPPAPLGKPGQQATPSQAAKGIYIDRFGTRLEKTFQGPALIDGVPVDYASWPLVDNPWIHQDWDGNMRISDGITERIYDVTNWTITEQKVGTTPKRK